MKFTMNMGFLLGVAITLVCTARAEVDIYCPQQEYSRQQEPSLQFYLKKYTCNKAWSMPWLWWGMTGSQEFIVVNCVGNYAHWEYTMEPAEQNKVFGLYSQQEIDNPYPGLPAKIKAHTLRYLRIIKKDEWIRRLSNNFKMGLVGGAAIIGSIVGTHASQNFSWTVLGVAGAAAVWYAIQRHYWVQALGDSKKLLHKLYSNQRDRTAVFPENARGADDCVIITHGEVNEALCKHMNPGEGHYCPLCLSGSGKQHVEKVNEGVYFFGNRALNQDDAAHKDDIFPVVTNTIPLELHKPCKKPEELPKLELHHKPAPVRY